MEAQLEPWYDASAEDLPEALRIIVEQQFAPVTWANLTSEQRRFRAREIDLLLDPAMEDKNQYWFNHFGEIQNLEHQIAECDKEALQGAPDHQIKEEKKARLIQLKRRSHYPNRRRDDGIEDGSIEISQLIPFKITLIKLIDRWGASEEEMAAWVCMGPRAGGLKAFIETDDVRRFDFEPEMDLNYRVPLLSCKFDAQEVKRFNPKERFLTGGELYSSIDREFGDKTHAYVVAKMGERKLNSFHPVAGATGRDDLANAGFSQLETDLFPLTPIIELAYHEGWTFEKPSRLMRHQNSRETPAERKARLHQWYEEEIESGGKRGALDRTATREGRAHQTVRAILKKQK